MSSGDTSPPDDCASLVSLSGFSRFIEIRKSVLKPPATWTMDYTDQAVGEIMSYTEGYPYLIQ